MRTNKALLTAALMLMMAITGLVIASCSFYDDLDEYKFQAQRPDVDPSLLCGNDEIDEGETCDGDCPETCDDLHVCTINTMLGSAETCNVECVAEIIETCQDDDGCCPQGCHSLNDSDCSPAPEFIRLGWNHSCMVLIDGTLRCWGANRSGQLGDGSTSNRSTAIRVPNFLTATSLALGFEHTCVLLDDGEVHCWGYNNRGQLGDGSTANSPEALLVEGLPEIVNIAAGQSHTCAVTVDGELYCWGLNGAGQIGDGTTDERHEPTLVESLGDEVVQVVAGMAHTCARIKDGTIRCWGQNDAGQLGDASNSPRSTPVPLFGLQDSVKDLALGSEHSCALLDTNEVICWGNNLYGQLGNDAGGSNRPMLIANFQGVQSISSGGNHTCGI
ncbi:MAG: RCC1 domain-containing protein, partial [Bradymonadaceae bacterium]